MFFLCSYDLPKKEGRLVSERVIEKFQLTVDCYTQMLKTIGMLETLEIAYEIRLNTDDNVSIKLKHADVSKVITATGIAFDISDIFKASEKVALTAPMLYCLSKEVKAASWDRFEGFNRTVAFCGRELYLQLFIPTAYVYVFAYDA